MAACAAGVAYTYVGYPALVAWQARVRPRPPRTGDVQPTVTLVVPAHNEADVIADKLRNSLALDYPAGKVEVVVVDDGSTDGTGDTAATFPPERIRLLRQEPRQGKMAAVQRGVEAATGEVIVLTDASAILEPDALARAVRYFADPAVGVVSGRIRLVDRATAVEHGAGLYWRYEDAIRRWEGASGSTVGVNGNFFAYRRDTHPRLPSGTVNDEFSIAMLIAGRGLRIVYAPEVVANDFASASMADEWSRRARIGAGRYQALLSTQVIPRSQPVLVFRLLSHKVSRSVAPFLLGGLALTTGVRLARRPRSGTARAAGGAQALFYVLAAAGWRGEGTAWGKRKPFSVPYYFVAGNLSQVAGLARFLRRRQSVVWAKRAALSGRPTG